MTKTLLRSSSLLLTVLTVLLSTACSTPPDAPAATDQLIFQVCLRDKQLAHTKQLDFTIVRADKRDIESAISVGASLKQQAIFEGSAGNFASIKTTVLSMDRSSWYGFAPPVGARLGAWTDWQAADYLTRSEDAAYKLQHDLTIEKEPAGAAAVKIRYRMRHYQDMLATRALQRLELPRTDFAPC